MESRWEEIDQTLAIIAARHASLARTMEILVGIHRENQKRFEASNARMDVLTERTIQAMDAINRLDRIAESHEPRRDDLEENP